MTKRILPGTRVSSAMRSPIFEGLTPIESLIYLRLVALCTTSGFRVRPRNAELHKANDATIKALRSLADRGIISIRHDPKIPSVGREITVLR